MADYVCKNINLANKAMLRPFLWHRFFYGLSSQLCYRAAPPGFLSAFPARKSHVFYLPSLAESPQNTKF
ncbi:hypothetical protein COO59_09755 [Mixta theicola]|uniref:Uncharacterized protein n=1 Tax=Mixta theicola TaxID=1458355 RepID=A0A2K1Q9T2_9GAMM|nr:hypothetical protein COO59_09755 [Mixta theicola]